MLKQRNRLLIFFLFVSIVVSALIGRLVYIHIFWRDELTELARSQQNKTIPVPAKRGDIIDRNGDKMAFSIKTFSVWVNAPMVTKPQETAILISETLGIDHQAIADAIVNATSTHVKVVKDLTKGEADLLRAKGIRGISIGEDTKRIYPYGALASHMLGIVNIDGDGFLGIEMAYNDLLKGKNGQFYITTDVQGRQLPYGEEEIVKPTNGATIQLTVDDTIQFFTEQRLQEAMIRYDAKSVSAIILNPMTGEILAMASKPDFDLNEPRVPLFEQELTRFKELTPESKIDYLNQMWRNSVISNTYEPGSTFKTITSAMALEEKLFSFDSGFTCNGATVVEGSKLHCWYFPRSHGYETFIQAYANSCNPAFVEIGAAIGPDRFYDYMDKFGFLAPSGVDLPAEGSSIVRGKDKWRAVDFATMSYGHGFNVTMLQIARAISAVVNGGHLMKPYVVKSIVDESGQTLLSNEPQVESNPISTSTSALMKEMMLYAATNGGKKVFIEGIDIGGKSGTTKKFVDGAYQDEVVISSFVGVVPIDNPQFLVLVTVDEPKVDFLGSVVASPVVKDIINDILRYKNIVPDTTPEKTVVVPDLKNATVDEAKLVLEKLELGFATEPETLEGESIVIDHFPKAGTEVTKGTVVILSIEE